MHALTPTSVHVRVYMCVCACVLCTCVRVFMYVHTRACVQDGILGEVACGRYEGTKWLSPFLIEYDRKELCCQ